MRKKYKSILILVTLLIFLILYLFHSNYIIQNSLDYSILFLTKLFPASFLFFVFSSLLIDYGIIETIEKIIGKSSSLLYVLLISMISGFPSGAIYTKELYEKEYINLKEANSYLLFSHFPNPLFIMGSVNMIIGNYIICLKIFISILLSNLIILTFSKKYHSNYKKRFQLPDNFSQSLSQAITKSFSNLITIYGTSLFFYLISSIIIKLFPLHPFLYILLNGLFDLTKGVFSTSILDQTIYQAYFILFFISFGGISIHMQVKGILANSSLSYTYFLKGRIIGTIFSILIFSLLLLI